MVKGNKESYIEYDVFDNIKEFNMCVVKAEKVISVETVGFLFWKKIKVWYIN